MENMPFYPSFDLSLSLSLSLILPLLFPPSLSHSLTPFLFFLCLSLLHLYLHPTNSSLTLHLRQLLLPTGPFLSKEVPVNSHLQSASLCDALCVCVCVCVCAYVCV